LGQGRKIEIGIVDPGCADGSVEAEIPSRWSLINERNCIVNASCGVLAGAAAQAEALKAH